MNTTRKQRAFIIALLVLTILQERPNYGYGSGQLGVHFIEGNLNIDLDGILNEDFWNTTPLWGPTPAGMIKLIPGGNDGSLIMYNYLLEVKGVYNLTHVALACHWNDTTLNDQKNQWIFNGTEWRNDHQQEDALGLIIRINDTREDHWYWHAALTDPLGYADDLYIVEGTVQGDEGEPPGFSENSYNSQTLSEGSFNNSDRPFWDRNGDIINDTSISNFEVNTILPGYFLSLPNGSRNDVAAKGHFDSISGWTVEFLRQGETEEIGERETFDRWLPLNGLFTAFIEDGIHGNVRFERDPHFPSLVGSFLFSPTHPSDTLISSTSSSTVQTYPDSSNSTDAQNMTTPFVFDRLSLAITFLTVSLAILSLRKRIATKR